MKEEKKSFSDQLQFYISKWKYFVVSVVVCLLIGVLMTYRKAPVYEVDANVLITDNDTQSDFLRSFSMADMFGGGASADEELLLISSYTLFNEVVREFSLNDLYVVRKNILKKVQVYGETPVKIEYDKTIPDTLNTRLIFKLKINDEGLVSITGKDKEGKFIKIEDKRLPLTLSTVYGKFRFVTTDFYDPEESLKVDVVVDSYAAATESLQEQVECFIPSRKANVITVSMKCTNIPFAEKVVNRIVDGYNERGIEETRTRNQVTFGFIDARLNAIADELNSTEVAVENYKNENNLVDLVADAQYIFTKKGTIDEALVTAETEYEILEMTRELMNDPSHRYDLIPTPYGAEAAVDAIAEYNKLILERMKLVNNAKTNNNAALRTISSQLDAMRENINATLDRSLASARVKLHDLREQMNESDSRLGKLPRQEREFLNIKRQQMVKENLYLFLLKQREETSLRIANAIPKGTIVDKAYAMTKPVSMSPKMMLFVAFIFGLLIPPVFFYVKKSLRNKISTRRELEELTDIPVVGEINLCHDNSSIIAGSRDSQIMSLASNLQFMMRSSEKVIAVTSIHDGDGKSFVASKIAESLAVRRKKVILVELDLNNSGIAESLGLSNGNGLVHYISSDDLTVNDIITRSGKSVGYDVVVAGAVLPNHLGVLMTDRTVSLFDELRKYYDYVIVDCFAMNGVNDAVILSKISDMTIFVCRANHTLISDVKKINAICKNNNLEQYGLIFNDTKHCRNHEK